MPDEPGAAGAVATPEAVPEAIPGGGSVVETTPAGFSAAVTPGDSTVAQTVQTSENVKSFLNTVPSGYTEKGWVKELTKAENPQQELFKQMENLQAMRGQKTEGLKVPGEGATEDDWTAFNKAIGVPEKAEDYAYEPPKAPEGQEKLYATDDKFLNTMKTAAHKAGVTPAGWQKMTAEYNTFVHEAIQAGIKQQADFSKQVQENFTKQFGDKAPQVLNIFNTAVNATPDSSPSKQYLQSLGPEARSAMAELFNNFSKKYVSEDRLDIKDGLSSLTGEMSETEYGNEYGRLMALMRNNKPGSAEHIQAKDAMVKLRARGGEVFKKK